MSQYVNANIEVKTVNRNDCAVGDTDGQWLTFMYSLRPFDDNDRKNLSIDTVHLRMQFGLELRLRHGFGRLMHLGARMHNQV